MPETPWPEPKTADEDWREYLELCGLGEPDVEDYEYFGTLREERDADES
jgi:hypothetical protein